MSYQRITIQITGVPADSDRPHLFDFIEQLDAVRTTLSRLENEIAEPGSPPIQYRIADLSFKSPPTVVLEVVPPPKGENVSALVNRKWMEIIKSIKAGSLPEGLETDVLRPFKRIGPPAPSKKRLQSHLSRVSIAIESESVVIDKSLGTEIEKIVGPDEFVHGSVNGVLEQLNIHGDANIFRIYPIVGPKKVDCHFKKEKLENAIAGINHYVGVHGLLRYKRRDRFPYAIDVSEIERYPDEEELPSIFDLKGIAPQATGNLKSEDFIAQLRDENW